MTCIQEWTGRLSLEIALGKPAFMSEVIMETASARATFRTALLNILYAARVLLRDFTIVYRDLGHLNLFDVLVYVSFTKLEPPLLRHAAVHTRCVQSDLVECYFGFILG